MTTLLGTHELVGHFVLYLSFLQKRRGSWRCGFWTQVERLNWWVTPSPFSPSSFLSSFFPHSGKKIYSKWLPIKRQLHKIKHVFKVNVNKYVFNYETLELSFPLKTSTQRLICLCFLKCICKFSILYFPWTFPVSCRGQSESKHRPCNPRIQK